MKDGQANEWNAFHCLFEQKGVTCTVIAGGHGFESVARSAGRG